MIKVFTADNHVTSKKNNNGGYLDSDKTSFDISVNTGQIGTGFKADTPKK